MNIKVNHKSPYGEYVLGLGFGKYANKQTRIQLYDIEDGMPFMTASVSLPDYFMEEDEVAIKNYSENAGILESLIAADIIEKPHKFIQSGFTQIPICKIKTFPTNEG